MLNMFCRTKTTTRKINFDMNHLIDWCQVSSISALLLMELLLQAVNSHVSKKEIWHCIRAVSWLFDCWKTQMVVSVYFVMNHQQSFLTDSFHNLDEFCCCFCFCFFLRAKKSSVRKKEKSKSGLPIKHCTDCWNNFSISVVNRTC